MNAPFFHAHLCAATGFDSLTALLRASFFPSEDDFMPQDAVIAQIDLDDVRCAECGERCVSAFTMTVPPRLTFACINPDCPVCATPHLLII